MTWLGLPLTLLAGASLGALGAGGSILMMPILVYVIGVPAKDAIPLSLMVVGTTSAAALLSPGRLALVQWRTGLWFGGAAMAAAYGGGVIAARVPAQLLLAGFALLMIGAAGAMLRTGEGAYGVRAGGRAPRLGRVLGMGALVGFVAGLVGAGGGFLIVPALVLFGGLAIRPAVATSLLVIALQSLAGLAGHAAHARIDFGLSAALIGLAVAGSIAGARLASKASPSGLRRGLAWFVAAIGVSMLLMQVPWNWLSTVIEQGSPWAALAGGVLIGLAAALLWLLNGRIAGVSGIAGGLLDRFRGDFAWRALFVLGLLAGGATLRVLAPAAFAASPATPDLILVAGFLVGLGTTLANGCTSGHGVCGVSRLSPRSLVAVGSFMAAGMVTVYVIRHVLGGAS